MSLNSIGVRVRREIPNILDKLPNVNVKRRNEKTRNDGRQRWCGVATEPHVCNKMNEYPRQDYEAREIELI